VVGGQECLVNKANIFGWCPNCYSLKNKVVDSGPISITRYKGGNVSTHSGQNELVASSATDSETVCSREHGD
jgi:hypothetical protein